MPWLRGGGPKPHRSSCGRARRASAYPALRNPLVLTAAALLLAACSDSTPFDPSGVDLAGTWRYTVTNLTGNGQQGVPDNFGGYAPGPCTATWTASARTEPGYPAGTLYTEVPADATITCPSTGSEPWYFRGAGLVLERQPEGVVTLMRLTGQYFARGTVKSDSRVEGQLTRDFGNKPFTAERVQ